MSVKYLGRFASGAGGNVYVTNNFATGSSYYVVDGASVMVAVNGPSLNICNYPTVSADQSRLYLGQLGTTYSGYVTLATGAATYFTGDPTCGPAVVHSAETYLYVGPGLGAYLNRMRISDGALMDSVAIPGPGALASLAISASSAEVYVAVYSGGPVFCVYTTSTQVITGYAIADRSGARGIAVNPTNGKVYITCANGAGTVAYVIIVDPATGTKTDELILSDTGKTIVFKPDGSQFAVINYTGGGGNLWIYRTSDKALLYTIPGVGAYVDTGLAYDAAGKRLYLAAGTGLDVFETDTYTQVGTVSLAGGVYGVDTWP